MKIRSVFVYTHDSIGLGEDGPTHQAVEQLATLRMIPGMSVWRPCDVVEAAIAWKAALERQDGPTCLVFTRQTVPYQPRKAEQLANITRGAYILIDCEGTPDEIIIATGSEVHIAVEAAERLMQKGKKIRVVSMPSTNTFDAQDEAYKESVLPSNVRARIAVEAGVSDYWRKYVGWAGKVVGINTFGESAPAAAVMKYFGFTAENVVRTAEAVMAACNR